MIRRALAAASLLALAGAPGYGQIARPEPSRAATDHSEDTFALDPSAWAAAPNAAPQTWGESIESLYVVDSSELYPLAPGNHYGVFNGTLRYSSQIAGLAFIAPLHLPSGAQITSLRMDYYDSSTTGQALGTLYTCDYRGQTCSALAVNPFCGTTICSGADNAPGYNSTASVLTGTGTVDNFANRYFLAAGNDVIDGSVAISQFVVGYVLQVSPAPDTATFADVPTSHPFFQ
ncbi:MAG TPA: hypothetical protein VH854_12470, partial [Thermoanaerobaculia bacterium]|nr:hypothetical protein [Thermoanaerobaculia bacterium]